MMTPGLSPVRPIRARLQRQGDLQDPRMVVAASHIYRTRIGDTSTPWPEVDADTQRVYIRAACNIHAALYLANGAPVPAAKCLVDMHTPLFGGQATVMDWLRVIRPYQEVVRSV